MNILIIDDDEEILSFMQDVLAGEGHRVALCSDGASGLGVLSSRRFDMVISDLRMPRMHGEYVIEIIRAKYPVLPIVVLSGYVTDEKALIKQGVDRVLTKPVDVEELFAVVKDMAPPPVFKPFTNRRQRKKTLIDKKRKN